MAHAYYARQAVGYIDSHRRAEGIIIVIMIARKELEGKKMERKMNE